MISSTVRSENFRFLYTGQKRHWFQGQFLVNRSSRLLASLGGRIGPCSNVSVCPFIYSTLLRLVFSLTSTLFKRNGVSLVFSLYLKKQREYQLIYILQPTYPLPWGCVKALILAYVSFRACLLQAGEAKNLLLSSTCWFRIPRLTPRNDLMTQFIDEGNSRKVVIVQGRSQK